MLTVSVDPSATVPPFVELRWVVLMTSPPQYSARRNFVPSRSSRTSKARRRSSRSSATRTPAFSRNIDGFSFSEFAKRGGAEVEKERDWADRVCGGDRTWRRKDLVAGAPGGPATVGTLPLFRSGAGDQRPDPRSPPPRRPSARRQARRRGPWERAALARGLETGPRARRLEAPDLAFEIRLQDLSRRTWRATAGQRPRSPERTLLRLSGVVEGKASLDRGISSEKLSAGRSGRHTEPRTHFAAARPTPVGIVFIERPQREEESGECRVG